MIKKEKTKKSSKKTLVEQHQKKEELPARPNSETDVDRRGYLILNKKFRYRGATYTSQVLPKYIQEHTKPGEFHLYLVEKECPTLQRNVFITARWYEFFRDEIQEETLAKFKGVEMVYQKKHVYPGDECFGKWAFCCKDEETIVKCFKRYIINYEKRGGDNHPSKRTHKNK